MSITIIIFSFLLIGSLTFNVVQVIKNPVAQKKSVLSVSDEKMLNQISDYKKLNSNYEKLNKKYKKVFTDANLLADALVDMKYGLKYVWFTWYLETDEGKRKLDEYLKNKYEKDKHLIHFYILSETQRSKSVLFAYLKSIFEADVNSFFEDSVKNYRSPEGFPIVVCEL